MIDRNAKGTRAELRTAALLEADGWTVGSRRHVPGPGDLLAVKVGKQPRLIEVKASSRPYTNFRGPDREEMRVYAAERGLKACLAWWGPRMSEPDIIGVEYWPVARSDRSVVS